MTGSCQDDRITRRAMLGTTAAAGATILGLPVGQLLADAGTAGGRKAEHVILFWNGGGMSHLDTWDPKPGRPTQGEFGSIDTSASGIQISEIFPQLAQQMHHCAIIRSIAGTEGAHRPAAYNLQTGYSPAGNLVHPGIGSVVAHQLRRQGDLPCYISISGRARRATYLGQKCEAHYVPSPGQQDPDLSFPGAVAELRGDSRLEVLARDNARSATGKGSLQRKNTQTAIDDAVGLTHSPALKAFDLDTVPTTTWNRYGDTTFGRGALLAKRLVETGVRFVQVNRGGFDTHSNNFSALRAHADVMDPALASLIEDLAESGLLKKTLVLMLSEFGRTPRINRNAGRDHWAPCFSCFMAGGGIRGGTVVGSSDKDGYQPNDRPVRVPDIHATLCHSMGIDPDTQVRTPLQRPMKLIDNGKPVGELFA